MLETQSVCRFGLKIPFPCESVIRCRPRHERGREFLFTSKSVVDSAIGYIDYNIIIYDSTELLIPVC